MMQLGQMPPVSNVCHSWPQEQPQTSSREGSQSQSGQRMRGPVTPKPIPGNSSVMIWLTVA